MSDYWSAQSALAEEALLSTTFTKGAVGVAKALDPGTNQVDVKEGGEVDAPLWLVAPLIHRGMATFKLPPMYGERYRRKMAAGAECLSFKIRAPNIYDVGNKMNEFLRDTELSGCLSRTFKTRYQELLSRALTSVSGEQVLELQSKLSAEEAQLFEAGRLSVAETERWLGDRPRAMGPMTAPVAVALGGRKRAGAPAAAGVHKR